VRASRLGAASSSTALARLSGDTRNRPLRHYIWGESSSGICAHTACSSTPWPNPHSTRQRRPAPPSSRHTARHACVPPARLRAPEEASALQQQTETRAAAAQRRSSTPLTMRSVPPVSTSPAGSGVSRRTKGRRPARASGASDSAASHAAAAAVPPGVSQSRRPHPTCEPTRV